MDEASQVEKVRQHQVAVAKSMGFPPAVLEVLSQTEDWRLREWLYICALDGFPLDKLQEHARKKTDVATLCKIREEFWHTRSVRADALQRDVESLGREVRQASRESKEARAAIETGLEETMKRREREHAEELQVKESAIRLLRRQIASLEEQLGRVKGEKERLPANAGANVPDSNAQGKTKGANVRKTENDGNVGDGHKDERKGRGEQKEQTESAASNTRAPQTSFLQAMASRMSARRRERETERFIEKFVVSGALKAEQVDFLLACLEEGVSVREMERFAAPGIPVDVMRRLKEVDKKGGRGGRAGSGRGNEGQ